MTGTIKSWFTEHYALVFFLIAQGAAILTYMVRLETRVSIMETRGAAYTVERLNRIDEKITILETITQQNKASIDKVIEVMTRELNKERKNGNH